MANTPNGEEPAEPPDAELLKLILETRELYRLIDEVRTTIDSDPIDLRETLAR